MRNAFILKSKREFKLWVWCTLTFAIIRTIPMLADFNYTQIFISLIKKLLLCGIILYILLWLWNWIFGTQLSKNSTITSQALIRPKVIFTLFFFLILILWLPAFLALYPGTFGADAPIQEAMFRGLYPLSDHHPLIHTFLLGSFIQLGITFFNNASFGFGLYIFLIQMMLCAFAISSALTYLYRRKVPLWILIMMMGVLCINPYIQTLVCYSTKDIPFAAVFLLYIVNILYLLFPPEYRNRINKRLDKRLIYICFFGFLSIQLRSQGLYILIVALPVLAVYLHKTTFRKRFHQFLFCQVLIVILAITFNSISARVLNSEHRDSREALSVPIQQFSAAITENVKSGEKFLDSELIEDISKYFDGYHPDMYNKYVADVPKSIFKTNEVKKNPSKFIRTYLKTIAANPSIAIRSYIDLIKPYFDFTQTPYNNLVIETSFEDLNKDLEIQQYSFFPLYREYLTSAIQLTNFGNCPVVLKLFDFSWVLYILDFLLVFGLIYKSKLCIVCFIYPFLYIGTMFLGPMALLRYAFIYAIQWPLYLGCIWITYIKQRN